MHSQSESSIHPHHGITIYCPIHPCKSIHTFHFFHLSNMHPTPSVFPLLRPFIHPFQDNCPPIKGATDRDRESVLKKWSQTLHQITSSRQITHESLLICLPLCPICPSGSNAPTGSAVRPDQLLDPPLIIGPKNEKDLQGTGRKWHTEKCLLLNPCLNLWQFTNMDE